MYHYYGIVRGFTGPGLASTSVTVYTNAAGTVNASLYDSVGGGLANPTTTNARGAIDVYCPSTPLWYKVAGDTVVQPLPMYDSGGGMVNVRDYGATGDGVTDDTTAIAAALTSGAGGAVVFPQGTYLCTTLSVPANTTLMGIGKGSVVKLKNATNDNLLEATSQDNITVRDIILDGNHVGQTGASHIIFFDECDDLRMSHVRAINGYGAVGSTGSDAAVAINNCARGVFVGCDCLSAKYDGWMFTGATGGYHTVHGGRFSECGYAGIGSRTSPYVRLFGVIAQNDGIGNVAGGISLNGIANEAHGCIATGCTAAGINIGHDEAIYDASDSKVIGGYATGNADAGVNVYGGTTQNQNRVVVQGVTSYGNTDDGVRLLYANECVVCDIVARANGRNGLYVRGDDNLIANVWAKTNDNYGVHILSGSRNRLVNVKAPIDATQATGVYDQSGSSVVDGHIGKEVGSESHTGTTDATTVKTTTMPAGLLGPYGGVRITASGGKTGATGTKTIKLYFGTQVLAEYTVNDELAWSIEAEVMNAAAATQSFSSRFFNGTALAQQVASGSSIDTAAAVEIKVQVTLADAGDAVNVRHLSVVQTIPPSR